MVPIEKLKAFGLSLLLIATVVFAASTPSVAQSWNSCASEGGTCIFGPYVPANSLVTLQFGDSNGNNSYIVVSAGVNSVSCNTSVFGDPSLGNGKNCQFAAGSLFSPPLAPPSSPSNFFAVNEGGFFAYNNNVVPAWIMFGTNTNWVYALTAQQTANVNYSATCSNGQQGHNLDPSPGQSKVCQYLFPAASLQSISLNSCAAEGNTCAFPTTTGVYLVSLFSAAAPALSTFAMMQGAGVQCSIGNGFHVDPAVGQAKSCSVSANTIR